MKIIIFTALLLALVSIANAEERNMMVVRGAILTTDNGEKVFLPTGTRVRVTAFLPDGNVKVRSLHGNPSGNLPGWAVEEEKKEAKPLSPLPTTRSLSGKRVSLQLKLCSPGE